MRSEANAEWLSLDVGGANIKAAHSRGETVSVPFELWRAPQALVEKLEVLAASMPAFDRVVLTMTAELCDCFGSKAEGVRHVLAHVCRMAASRPVDVWCIDGRFQSTAAVEQKPELAAASNWLALAMVAARLVEGAGGLLIDVGSTTTDVIGFQEGRAFPYGRTDFERLRSGELVYAGVRRTPVCALAAHVSFQGEAVGVASEFFATTHDVYLVLGETEPDERDRQTADGRPATRAFAEARLARAVCCDLNDLGAAGAQELARAFGGALESRIQVALAQVIARVGIPVRVVVAGSGSFLARRLATRLVAPSQVVSLDDIWGTGGSVAACARAVLTLAEEAEFTSA
jgi:probable H4MPT-linked C1 transfer pathway protein